MAGVRQRARQRHAAVDAALAVAHPDEEALGVDVACLEGEALAEAEAEGVDRGECDASHRVADGAEHGA